MEIRLVNKNIKANFAEELLKERGLTMNDLAASIGTTQTSISRMLGENGNPTYETLVKVASALGVDIKELFGPSSIPCPHCGKPIEISLLKTD